MSKNQATLVGTKSVNVNIYEYQNVEWIDHKRFESRLVCLDYDYYDYEDYPENCRLGKGDINEYKSSDTIEYFTGKTIIDFSGVRDISFVEGIIFFKTPKTLRVYQYETKEDGNQVFITVV